MSITKWDLFLAASKEPEDRHIIGYDEKAPAASYPDDDGPISAKYHRALRELEPAGRMVTTDSLI